MHVQITLQGFEVEPVLSLGTKRNCVSRLVASSISTNKVQALKRAMITAMDLDQFAVALAPETWLVEGPSLLTQEPSPSATIHRRRVSRPVMIECYSSRISVASVGPKSAYFDRTSSTAYSRTPGTERLFDERPRDLWMIAPPPPSR